MSAPSPRKEQHGGVLADVKATPYGWLTARLDTRLRALPPDSYPGAAEKRSLQIKSPRNQGNPEISVGLVVVASSNSVLDAGVCLVAQFDTVRSGRIQHLRAVKKLRMVVAVVRRNQPITHRRRRWGLG
jgi:hypothetical protein